MGLNCKCVLMSVAPDPPAICPDCLTGLGTPRRREGTLDLIIDGPTPADLWGIRISAWQDVYYCPTCKRAIYEPRYLDGIPG